MRTPVLGAALACLAHFLVGADGLAVVIALPAIEDDLDLSSLDAQWVLTGYSLTFGGLLLVGGRLGDAFGARRLLAGGLATFAAGSVAAAAAGSLAPLVAARALQGAGAAAAAPAALALIGTLFPAGPARTRALAMLAAMASAGVVTGLLLGGVLTEALGWRWVFLATAPVALLGATAGALLLPASRPDGGREAVDVVGAALGAGAMVALVWAVTRVERAGPLALPTLVPLAGACVLGVAFVAWERGRPVPLVRFGILRIRSFSGAALGTCLNAVAFTGIAYVGSLYMQRALGYSPAKAAVALVPIDVVTFLIGVAGGGAIARRAPRSVAAGAFGVTAVALLWLARAPDPAVYWRDLLLPFVVLGCSLTAAYVVLNQEAVADVPAHERGLAAGVFETANHLVGGAIGVALYATVLAAAGSYAAPLAVAAGLALCGTGAALLLPHVARSGPAG